ncbi:hypothetical protein MalM25_15640 [Planctomycetes bacterium MalM25]|nr:hypothetical protein MalM25_15640 [Planctomycetes bacterium MalM25]
MPPLNSLPLFSTAITNMPSIALRCLLILSALLTAGGCSEMPATVSGRVTVGGEAHEGLRVGFIPQAGGATAISKTDADGNYTIRTGKARGLMPGEYRVTVSGYTRTPSPNMSAAEVDALRIVGVEHSNRKTSPNLTVIEPGGNVFDLNLPAP